MIHSTTRTLAGKTITRYYPVVTGEAILGANAIVGIDIDYQNVGTQGGMLLVSVSGTAVAVK